MLLLLLGPPASPSDCASLTTVTISPTCMAARETVGRGGGGGGKKGMCGCTKGMALLKLEVLLGCIAVAVTGYAPNSPPPLPLPLPLSLVVLPPMLGGGGMGVCDWIPDIAISPTTTSTSPLDTHRRTSDTNLSTSARATNSLPSRDDLAVK